MGPKRRKKRSTGTPNVAAMASPVASRMPARAYAGNNDNTCVGRCTCTKAAASGVPPKCTPGTNWHPCCTLHDSVATLDGNPANSATQSPPRSGAGSSNKRRCAAWASCANAGATAATVMCCINTWRAATVKWALVSTASRTWVQRASPARHSREHEVPGCHKHITRGAHQQCDTAAVRGGAEEPVLSMGGARTAAALAAS